MISTQFTGIASHSEPNTSVLFFDLTLDNNKTYKWSDIAIVSNMTPSEYIEKNKYIYVNSILEQIEEWEEVGGIFVTPARPNPFMEESGDTTSYIEQDDYVKPRLPHAKISEVNPIYNPLFEKVNDDSWSYNESTNRYEKNIENLTYLQALGNCAGTLEMNRLKYEVSGLEYNYKGSTVVIMTDPESSQPKLAAARVSADQGDRQDTDTWKFLDTNGNLLIFQLTNEELIAVSTFVYRAIQDSYNLTSATFWAMLGAGDFATLKSQVLAGTIDLNPWGV